MKTLVISDIHHRWVRAQNIIDTVPHDKAILLGDYFDSFGDNPQDANNTAVWLRDIVLEDPRNTVLMGNHDQYYRWPLVYTYLHGSGFSPAKHAAINKELHKEHWDKFKFYHIDQGWVFSHAGLSVHLWKMFLQWEDEDSIPNKYTNTYFDKIVGKMVDRNLLAADTFQPAPLFAPGWDRGGFERHGGITWVDWRSFAPIKGINQIFGHTPHAQPEILTQGKEGNLSRKSAKEYSLNRKSIHIHANSVNIALDTHSDHYAVIEHGEVTLYVEKFRQSYEELANFAIPENPMSGL